MTAMDVHTYTGLVVLAASLSLLVYQRYIRPRRREHKNRTSGANGDGTEGRKTNST